MALEQEEQQRRDRAPARCWELQKLHTNRPQAGKCKIPGGPREELGETAGGGGFGAGPPRSGNISPGEAGGEMSHHLQRERQPERRPGSWGQIRVQGAGSAQGPWITL